MIVFLREPIGPGESRRFTIDPLAATPGIFGLEVGGTLYPWAGILKIDGMFQSASPGSIPDATLPAADIPREFTAADAEQLLGGDEAMAAIVKAAELKGPFEVGPLPGVTPIVRKPQKWDKRGKR